MIRIRTAVAAILLIGTGAIAGAPPTKVLIVMDEREQMEVLAGFFKDNAGVHSTIVDQAGVPPDWSGFVSVVGYIHGRLDEKVESRFIDYAKAGGRLILLHHSISGAKSANRYLFGFLGIELTDAAKSREPSTPGGHYAWRDPVEQVIVNLRPGHFVTSHLVEWPTKATYNSSDAPSVEAEYPAMVLKESEAYVNHKFIDGRAKTVLLGFRWADDRNGAVYMQDRTAWYKRTGKGWVFYFQPGHSTQEFRNPALARMILNAILWSPTAPE